MSFRSYAPPAQDDIDAIARRSKQLRENNKVDHEFDLDRRLPGDGKVHKTARLRKLMRITYQPDEVMKHLKPGEPYIRKRLPPVRKPKDATLLSLLSGIRASEVEDNPFLEAANSAAIGTRADRTSVGTKRAQSAARGLLDTLGLSSPSLSTILNAAAAATPGTLTVTPFATPAATPAAPAMLATPAGTTATPAATLANFFKALLARGTTPTAPAAPGSPSGFSTAPTTPASPASPTAATALVSAAPAPGPIPFAIPTPTVHATPATAPAAPLITSLPASVTPLIVNTTPAAAATSAAVTPAQTTVPGPSLTGQVLSALGTAGTTVGTAVGNAASAVGQAAVGRLTDLVRRVRPAEQQPVGPASAPIASRTRGHSVSSADATAQASSPAPPPARRNLTDILTAAAVDSDDDEDADTTVVQTPAATSATAATTASAHQGIQTSPGGHERLMLPGLRGTISKDGGVKYFDASGRQISHANALIALRKEHERALNLGTSDEAKDIERFIKLTSPSAKAKGSKKRR